MLYRLLQHVSIAPFRLLRPSHNLKQDKRRNQANNVNPSCPIYLLNDIGQILYHSQPQSSVMRIILENMKVFMRISGLLYVLTQFLFSLFQVFSPLSLFQHVLNAEYHNRLMNLEGQCLLMYFLSCIDQKHTKVKNEKIRLL